MNARRTFTALCSSAAALGAAVGMGVAAAPASAAPTATAGTQFHVVEDIVNPTHYRMIFSGTFPMQQSDAVGFMTHLNEGSPACGAMLYLIYGDDGDAQYLFERKYVGAHDDIEGYLRAGPQGLEYRREILVEKPVLNEDADGRDEIYVKTVFLDADCVARVQYTNAFHGNL